MLVQTRENAQDAPTEGSGFECSLTQKLTWGSPEFLFILADDFGRLHRSTCAAQRKHR